MKTLDWDLIIGLYKQGYSGKSISEQLHCDRRTIDRKIRKLGLQRSQREQVNAYDLDINFFANIDVENKAYWFGFLLADGCIVKRKTGERPLILTLAQKDKIHVERFRNTIQSSAPIKSGVTFNKPNVRLNINSKVFTNHLLLKGWYDFKKYGKWPEIPKYLEFHFLRGFFDGDGWVSRGCGRPEIGLCSEFREPLERAKEILGVKANILRGRSIRSKKDIYKWRKNGYDCIRIYKLLYSNATIFLQRKRDYLSRLINNLVETDKIIKDVLCIV